MDQEIQQLKKSPGRIVLLSLSVITLGLVFLLQHTDYFSFFCGCHSTAYFHFAFNKTFRVLVNDVCMLGIIHYWFNDKKITRLAFWIQMVDTLVLLPVYLVLKLTLEGDSEISNPLLSQLHRLIINPTLMILIFPAIYFQRLNHKF